MKLLFCIISLFLATVYANSYKAVDAYRKQDYLLAQTLWEKGNTSDDFYNLGNTLVALGKYQEAINAYDKALSLNNNNEDASYNKKLVLEFLNKKQKANNNKDTKPKNKTESPKPEKPKPMSENKQRQKQLMQIVPDEPGGLLRQQFLREHYQRVAG